MKFEDYVGTGILSSRELIEDDSAFRQAIRAQVGEADLVTVGDAVKEIMLEEALARSNGNLSQTSHLLGISRQGVQQMLQRFGLKERAEEMRAQEDSADAAQHEQAQSSTEDASSPGAPAKP